MKLSAEELLSKYLDQEMSAAELAAFEAELAADSGLRGELKEMEQLSGFLRTQIAVKDVPYADFFTSQLSRRLSEEALPAKSASAAKWWQMFTNPWLVPAMGVTTALVLTWALWNPGQPRTPDLVSNVYDPVTGHPLQSRYVADAEAVVIDLNGVVEWNADEKNLPFYFNHRKSHTVSDRPDLNRKEVNGPEMAKTIESQRPYNSDDERTAAETKPGVVTVK